MSLQNIKERLDGFGRAVTNSVGTVGAVGGFGLAANLVRSSSPDLGRKMQQIQQVYDTFGPESTTSLLASQAAVSAVKKMPDKLRAQVTGTANSLVNARPLISKILRLADTLARAV